MNSPQQHRPRHPSTVANMPGRGSSRPHLPDTFFLLAARGAAAADHLAGVWPVAAREDGVPQAGSRAGIQHHPHSRSCRLSLSARHRRCTVVMGPPLHGSYQSLAWAPSEGMSEGRGHALERGGGGRELTLVRGRWDGKETPSLSRSCFSSSVRISSGKPNYNTNQPAAEHREPLF